MKSKVKLDLHVHSIRSKCSLNTLKFLKAKALVQDFLFAITDHNLLTRIKKTIPGEEIKTNQGEIIGIYLQEQIKPWQDAFETIDQIHDQEGIAILAHPYDKIRKDAAKNPSKELLKKIDFVEFNGRSLKVFLKKVENIINTNKLNYVVGSDAHLPWELGKSYFVLNTKHNKEDFFNNPRLLKKEIIKNQSSALKNVVIKNIEIEKLINMLISGISSRTRRVIKSK